MRLQRQAANDNRFALTVGTRIYYTGDMANNPGFGTIIARHAATRLGSDSVTIVLDREPSQEWDEPEELGPGGGRLIRALPVIMFEPGPGRRFWSLEERRAHRAAELRRLYPDAFAGGDAR